MKRKKMIFKFIFLIIFIIFYTGCGSGGSVDTITEEQNLSVTPQPDIADKSVRPPKPPSISI